MASFVLPAHALPSIVSGSYYHAKFEGRSMACGGRFDSDALTAATNHHPCGAQLHVMYQNRDVVVEVTDRCGRCGIDLSRAAARELGLLRIGRASVRVERLGPRSVDRAGHTPEPSALGRALEPVKSVWIKPSAPSDDDFAEPPNKRQMVPTLRVGHVGAVPTAPIPSFWVPRGE
jgi:rare lipoprotein A